MNVYMVYYADEFEHLESVEIVKDTAIVHYVNEMIVNDAITDDSVRIFYNEHGHHPETETEASPIRPIVNTERTMTRTRQAATPEAIRSIE